MGRAVNFNGWRTVDSVVRALWPASCLVCGAPGEAAADRDLCRACHAALPWSGCACPRCALPLPDGEQSDARCGACLADDTPLDRVDAAFAYAAPLDRLLPMLKFHQSLASARLLGGLMAEALQARAGDVEGAVLVPIPLATSRLRQRGYNQALELARPLARRLSMPLEPRLLHRPRATGAQSRLGRAGRQRNLAGAFAVLAARRLPAHVVLVDDVMTTGATLESAALALRLAGVARVDAWVCARAA